MKKKLLLSIITMLICAQTLPNTHKEYADRFVASYIQNAQGELKCEPEDINIILNFLHFAYERSQSTMHAQLQTLAAVSATWCLWQNVAETRRNPSIDVPYIFDESAYLNLMQTAITAQKYHETVGITYAKALESILKERTVGNHIVVLAIEEIREHVRAAVVSSLTNVNEHITTLLEWATNKDFGISEEEIEQRDMLNYIASYIPVIATYSFVAMDKASLQASEDGWKILRKMQELTNVVWKTIETTRSACLRALYNKIYEIAQNQELTEDDMHIIFDQDGCIEKEQQEQFLPQLAKTYLF